MRGLTALLLLIASCAPALATVKVCNQFSHSIHLAFAYEGKGGWVSDGWLTIAPNACEIDTRHPDLTSFYYRAESDTYGDDTLSTWGNNREFSVKDGNFTLDRAEQKAAGARFVKFNGPDSYTDPLTMVTLTFLPDLNVTFSVPSQNAGAPPSGGGQSSPSPGPSTEAADLKSDPDFHACDTGTGEASMTACQRAIASGKFSGSLLATLYIDRGVAQKDNELAIADYTKAIEIDPAFALAYQNRGRRYFTNKDYRRALTDLNKSIQLDPKDARTYQVRGWVYEGKKDIRRALADYDNAVEIDPKFTRVIVDRGNVYFSKGDYTHALADFNHAIEVDPTYAFAYCNRGAVSARRGDFDQAIVDYNKAIELDPQLALAYANRAVAHEKLGSVGAAIADYTRGLEIDPNNEQSKSALKRLQGFYFNPNEKVTTPAGGNSTPSVPPVADKGNGPVKPSDKMDFIPDLPDEAPAPRSTWPTEPVPDKNFANETTDWKVAEQTVLERDVGTPTPLSLPGARRITTHELNDIGPQSLLVDVLDETGNHTTLPGAVHLPGAGNYGRGGLNDSIEKSLAKWLEKLTGRDKNRQIVFFCEGAQCWESYNAALRALNLGYRNVLWYRGGLASWKAAGLPLVAPVATHPVN